MDRRKFFGGAAAGAAASLSAPAGIAAVPPEPGSKPFLNLRDYGAVGDNETDDGPALQRALDALAAAGGGRLVVPPGKFLLKTPARKDFLGKASVIRIEGSGSAGQLVVDVGKGATAVRFDNVDHLTIEGVTFVGMPKPRKRVDAATALAVAGGEVSTVRDCDFYGLSTDSVLFAWETNLLVSRCAFLGCDGAGGVIRNHQWRGVRVEDCRFIDYGGLNGAYHDIDGPTLAWLVCTNPCGYPIVGVRQQNCVTVRNTVMDEGAAKGIFINPAEFRVGWVRIDGLEDNVLRNAGSVGVHLRNVDHSVIENCVFGYADGPVIDAVRLEGVTNAQLQRVLCVKSANRITADKACGKLRLEDCRYTTLSSAAKKTLVDGEAKG